jgi:hypothetical protein
VDIILHIGLPKTATSSIQNWAVEKSGYLERHGLHVLPTVMSAHRIAAEFVKDPQRALDADVLAIQAALPLEEVEKELAIAAAKETVTTSFVSSEYFYIANNKLVAAFFERLDLPVTKVIAFVRRQDLLASSGYNQDVKAMKFSEPYEVGEYRPDYDYGALAESWRDAFPQAKIELRNFDKLAEMKSVIGQIASDIGQPNACDPADEVCFRANDALCAELLEIVRKANAAGKFEISDLAVRAQQAGFAGNPFLLARHKREQILSIYSDSNKKLVQYLGGSYENFLNIDDCVGRDLTNHFPDEAAVELLSYSLKNLA